MNPTALVAGAREDLFDRLPEPSAVADREVRRNVRRARFGRIDEVKRIFSFVRVFARKARGAELATTSGVVFAGGLSPNPAKRR